MMMKSHERTVLMLLFSANVLATSILIAGLAGIYYTGDPVMFPDYTWTETIYIIMQNLETLAYTIGASAPGSHPPPPFLLTDLLCFPYCRTDKLTKHFILKVLYRSIVGKSGSSAGSGGGRMWRLDNYKKSGSGSGGTTITNNTAAWSEEASRKGSMFKPAPIHPPTPQDVQKRDFDMPAQDSPHLYHDKARLTTSV